MNNKIVKIMQNNRYKMNISILRPDCSTGRLQISIGFHPLYWLKQLPFRNVQFMVKKYKPRTGR